MEVAGAKPLLVYQGKKRLPLEGRSMLPFWRKSTKAGDDRALFWQHETHAAVRRGKWKLVTENDRAGNISWELYDLLNDRSESVNLADKHPELVKKLAAEWAAYANRVSVTPFPETRKK